MRVYQSFWSKVFDVGLSEIKSVDFKITNSGAYVEKHKEKYIFLFTDLSSNKRIIAVSPQLMKHVSEQKLKRLGPKALGKLKEAFNDIDYGLRRKSAFRPAKLKSRELKILRLTRRRMKTVKAFGKRCSEEYFGSHF